jgi:hypothetical protein
MTHDETPRPRPRRGSLEKPRRARVKVDLWCEVGGSRNHATAHMSNLTVGGCRLLSPCAFPKGEVVEVALTPEPEEPDFKVRAEVRWLGLNPEEGPFVLGCQFVHSDGTADRIERILRGVMKKAPRLAPSRAAEPRKIGAPRLVFASDGLDRLLRPGLSAPLPGSPGAPRGDSSRS